MNTATDPATGPSVLSSDRLASLSDTMFGVAMTLLATTLTPSVGALTESPLVMLRSISGELSSVVLSFAISGAFWVSQQHRLAMTRTVTGWQTLLHLVFLFLIVLLPISTRLSGRGTTQGTVVVYGTHLALVGAANLLLWITVHRRVGARSWLVGSSVLFALLVTALAVGAVRPHDAQYFWLAGFAVPLVNRHISRWLRRAATPAPSGSTHPARQSCMPPPGSDS